MMARRTNVHIRHLLVRHLAAARVPYDLGALQAFQRVTYLPSFHWDMCLSS